MADNSQDLIWKRWAEVDDLLERVLDIPEAGRRAFLAEACPDDSELVEAVLALARDGSDTTEDELGPGPQVLRAALVEEAGVELDDADELVGTRAGAYRLVRILGTGGMGSVFEAERADEAFERTVAVKILRRSMTTSEVVRRFELERQILASLNHPAIAQLVDGGVTDDGRPFLVMELVEGVRIDEWADRKRLGVDERMRLILGVMEGVEHAHRQMVVHRDLKPSNILVREDGSVKLLDFGIARLLDEPTGEAAATRTGSRFLTPEYAAPEQLLGEPASAQTDVYSIAILLYELLTGARPYTAQGSTSILEQVVGGAEPTAPSSALPPVNTAGAPAGSKSLGKDAIYTARDTSHEVLRRALRGDVDAILMRALRARPSERYSTVSAFREDIERFLDGRAVQARGDARGYRLRKFIGRHRLAVATVGGAFLLTAGSALGLAIQRGNLIEQRLVAESATAEATREAETARAATAFLVDLFESNDPAARLGDTLTARALLERGVARIDTELGDQPAVRAELLGTLASVHYGLGWRDEAFALHQRAVGLNRDSVPGRVGLGKRQLAMARDLLDAQDVAAASAMYLEAIEAADAEGDSLTVAWARVRLGQALSFQNRLDEAELQLRTGLTLLPEPLAQSLDAWGAQQVLAGIVRRRGDLETADSLLTEVVVGRRAFGAGGTVGYVASLNDLAIVRRLLQEYDDAALLYEEVIDSADLVLGPAHPQTLMYRGNYAALLTSADRLDEAIEIYEASVQATREEWPDGHWRTASQLMQLGGTYIRAGRPEEALPYLSEAVDKAIEEIGLYHSWTNVYRAWLGVAATLTGRESQGEQFFALSLEGLSGYDELPDDRNVLAMITALVELMREQGLEGHAAPFEALIGDEPQ